ncbi:dephospho-CoA kinase [Falsigemmobacter faecalis]|uniref:Dephospho-CoA kinase n=1 Tax=Falsigemmobacter faecalis TaxID=2488730 RepID=A0A3P3DYH1_9RHOB|nr:dephospho-CoA kinase [Falsigemmobacter faecalis]RRH77868.1 dephospho-CoA kinase [Falsigemmobacter faecalis]
MTPYILGLTGGIGMGKSTTAAMFRAAGLPVWDADAAVHRLYEPGGAAVAPLARLLPEALVNGGIDRGALKAAIAREPGVLRQIEAIVHPLVAADRQVFIETTDAPVLVLDIPLLLEGPSQELCDGIAVVSVPAEVQRGRVLARGTMTEAEFERIRSLQMPDAEKRDRATWVIETMTLDMAQAKVDQILSEIRKDLDHA